MTMRLLLAVFAAFACAALPASAGAGKYFNVIDDGVKPAHGPVQLFIFRVGRASDKPDDFACVAYLGNDIVKSDHARAIALADQAFEEFVGPECAKAGFRSSVDGKTYGVGRCFVYVGDELVLVRQQEAFEQALFRGQNDGPAIWRAEYRMKDNPGRTDKEPRAVEFERISQPEIPVGPSLREPNTAAVSTEIAPGVTIALENKVDHTYYDDSKPHLFIFYETKIPFADLAAQRALAQKVVQALATERLKHDELKGVSVGAFNEARRSRFHFRLSYRYDTDDDGDMESENAPTAAETR